MDDVNLNKFANLIKNIKKGDFFKMRFFDRRENFKELNDKLENVKLL